MVLKLGNCKISKLPKKSTTWLFPFPRLDHSMIYCSFHIIEERIGTFTELQIYGRLGNFLAGRLNLNSTSLYFLPVPNKAGHANMHLCVSDIHICICIYMLNLHCVFGSFINMYAIFPHIRKYLYRLHTVWGFSMPFHVDMSLSMGINQSAYEKSEWPALVPTSPPRSSNCETHLLGGY